MTVDSNRPTWVGRLTRWALTAMIAAATVASASAQDARDARLGAAFDEVERAAWAADRDVPTFLAGDLGAATAADPTAFFAANAAVFGFAPELAVTRTETDALGLTHVRLQQTVGGVPVWGAGSVLHLRDGAVYAWGGDLHPGAEGVRTAPALDGGTAQRAAEHALGPVEYMRSVPADELGDGIDYSPQTELVVFPHEGGYPLAYHVRLFERAPTLAVWEVFVDAATGEVLDRFNSAHTFEARTATAAPASFAPFTDATTLDGFLAGPTTGSGSSLYSGTLTIPTYLSGSSYYLYDTTRGPSYIRTMTANNGTSLPGSYITDADNNFTSSSQRAGVDAHYGAITTYDYFKNTHGRNGFNGNNASITSTVHYGSNYNNAAWYQGQMLYGDGDGSQFSPLVELDIAAHEMTHAVTQYTANLIYQNESGALNESVSDIMAIMVDRNDYTVGEQSYTPGTPGDALRSLSNPPSEGQPDHYDDRYTGTGDNGGVHINSGIPNKVAYLMIAGGTHNGVSVQSIGRGATEDIWYRALATYFSQSTDFAGARQGTLQAAADLYGSGSSQYAAVEDAWTSVGVGTSGGGGGGGGGTPEWRYESASAQTPHPYANNYNFTHTYSKPGAQRVAMYFEQFELESGYDYVYIKDENNTTQASYTGTRSAFWAVVDGATIKSNIVTDYSVTDYGYRITQVAYFSDTPLLAGDGEEGEPLGYEPEASPSDVVAVPGAKVEVAELALAVGPNPARSSAAVQVSMPEAGAARVTVLDLLGRQVAMPHDGALERGVTPVAIPVADLPAGIYVVVLDADGQRLTERLTVVR